MTNISITRWPYNKRKVICFTWDDANYTHFYMALIFRWFGIKATHFIDTRELPRHYGFYHYLYNFIRHTGIDIGSHTRNHAILPDLSTQKAEEELLLSRQDLIDHFGVIPSTFSHPTSKISVDTDLIIKKYYLDSRYSTSKENDSAYEFMHVRRKLKYEEYRDSLHNFISSNKEIYIYGGHGLDGYGYEPMKWTVLWKILSFASRYLKEDCWIPTFSELAMYQKIRAIGIDLDIKERLIVVKTDKIKEILEKYPDTPAWITIKLTDGSLKTINLQKTNEFSY